MATTRHPFIDLCTRYEFLNVWDKPAVKCRNFLKILAALNYQTFKKSLLGVVLSKFLYILSLN